MKNALKQMARRRLRPQMLTALRNLAFEAKAGRVARRSGRAFRALEGRTGLKVHIGAGADIRPGWVNVDMALRVPPEFDAAAHPDTVLINHDLRTGLPLADGSCDYIYSSHFLEHLEQPEIIRLLADCHRVLRPGGTFRAGLPAFDRLFEAYLARDTAYFDLVEIEQLTPGVDADALTLVDYVNYGVYQFGEHRMIWDEEKAIRLLRKAGFENPVRSDYREGIDPSDPLRTRYSFYIEAVK